jgi:hypothetical protein
MADQKTVRDYIFSGGLEGRVFVAKWLDNAPYVAYGSPEISKNPPGIYLPVILVDRWVREGFLCSLRVSLNEALEDFEYCPGVTDKIPKKDIIKKAVRSYKVRD